MNNNYIINETNDIFESLGSYDSLCFVYNLLNLILNDIQYNIENDIDKKDYNRLTTCFLNLKEVLKNNESN